MTEGDGIGKGIASAAPAPAPAGIHDPPDAEIAAPLRDASPAERVFRLVLVAVVAGYVAFSAWEGARRPTLVPGGTIYAPITNAANAGTLARVDDTRDRYVLWERTDGHVFAERAYSLVDLRASIAAQPHVRANPGSVRYERIDAPPVEEPLWHEVADVFGPFVLVLFLMVGPPTRVATRWGWFWVIGTGIGTVAFLLLSGSHHRTVPERIALHERRMRGWQGALLLVAFSATAWLVGETVRPDSPSDELAPGVQVVRRA